jgi:hypothetical protein
MTEAEFCHRDFLIDGHRMAADHTMAGLSPACRIALLFRHAVQADD